MIDDPFMPLSDEEFEYLDKFLLYEVDSDEVMTIDILDGFLHAIAVGPTTIHPQQWLPKVWGMNSFMPPMASIEQLNHVLGLVMRHFNSIIAGLQAEQAEMTPVWTTQEFRGKTYEQGEGWAYGFIEGMQLCWNDWKPLLDTEDGKAWFRPIGLLGQEAYSADQDELTKTPARRAKLTEQIPHAVLAIYGYWLPYRQAVHEREMAKAMQPKVGRNETCPCGSGKKFKKCCGAAGALH
jgi:uncharacterized protein